MLIAHLLYRLDIGGLETVVVNLIDNLPAADFQHVVISLTDCRGEFKQRIKNPDVTLYQLEKKAGKDLLVWWRLWRLLRRLRPDLLHSCNLAAMEGVVAATLAGVPVKIHAEHGRDSYDLDGSNAKYLLLRRMLMPFIDYVVPVSRDLESWLQNRVGVSPFKIKKIVNGIRCDLPPRSGARKSLLVEKNMVPASSFVIGTVGRLWPVKDQANLLRGFAALLDLCDGEQKQRLQLLLIGDGPERAQLAALAQKLGIVDKIMITGWRDDVPRLLRALDLFVLPSLAEGTPLTILEAMAAGLPVVATDVGGVADLVVAGKTGTLVPASDHKALAEAMNGYFTDPEIASLHGLAGERRYRENFTLQRMVQQYEELFNDSLLQKTK